ncbi:MAG: hypothetical protein GEU83_18350 [Pseudonocardiaceae bacterium]|nr:hypothetical protein [Pseudonocardiaceae bacterium]
MATWEDESHAHEVEALVAWTKARDGARGGGVRAPELQRPTCPGGTLRTWASSYGVVALIDDPEDLSALERHLDAWAIAPEIGPSLGNEVGLYLGTVIVKNVPGAGWLAWPNGHPVVRLQSGRDLDVIALADQRLAGEGWDLPTIYTDAASS